MTRRALRAAGREDGGVLILWAILTPGMIFLLLLVIDVGNWYVHKRHLQMQADAAALAGGAHFGDCFSPDGATVAGANDAIKNAATAYAGNAASTYNFQVGGGSSRVTTLFNSRTFARGTYVDPDVDVAEPCQTPHLMFDVKQTEADVPYILGSLIDALVPGGTTVVPAINARARVQLKKATIMQGSLPLAVPDVDPKHVTATFVNESSGAVIAGPVELTKGAASAGLNWWQGSSSVSIPADTKVGVRIGLGGLGGACGPANGTGGTGYVCYDYTNTSIGLVAIRGVGSAGTPGAPTPRVWATTTCSSSGGPFFAPEDIAAPGTTCAASVQAVMESSTPIDMTKVQSFTATLNGGGLKNVTAPMTWSGGYWTTGYAFNVPAEGGAVDVSLTWKYLTSPKPTTTTYSNVQRIYSGVEEDSGPVKAVALTTSTGTTGAPYALDAGSHSLTVTVGLEPSLDLSEIEKTVMLRLTGGSR
ncbi:MAG: pilus assembly protein TadG-related protein, partial [Pseudomonadota bacterium]